jgi:hypothetical protein
MANHRVAVIAGARLRASGVIVVERDELVGAAEFPR